MERSHSYVTKRSPRLLQPTPRLPYESAIPQAELGPGHDSQRLCDRMSRTVRRITARARYLPGASHIVDVHDYVRILHKNWILILVLLIAGAGFSAAYTALQTPTYSATTQLYVSVRSEGAATGDLVQGTTFARQAVTSYADIVTTAIVLEPVIEQLGLDATASQLANKVAANTPANTVGIEITVTDNEPQVAADIANAIGASLSATVQDTLEKPTTAEAASPVQLTTVQPAVAPTSPSSPRVLLTIALGSLIGLALGIGVAVLRTVLETRVRTPHDLERLADAPILGGVVNDDNASKRPLIVHDDPRSPRAESFRALRTNLQFLNVQGGPRAFVISSSGPGEGKSTTAVNLSIALAQTGVSVALIEADLRIPSIARYMSIEGGAGLTDVLIGRAEVDDVLQKWGHGELYVLPSGPIPPNPSELLGSAAMDTLLESLTSRFDYVIVDAPPLIVTDAAVVSRKTRGVIMVAASGKSKKDAVENAIRTLDTAGGHLLGFVVTMLPTKGPDSYGYHNSYTYAAADA